MTEWTPEKRNQPYESYSEDYIKELLEDVAKSPWRAGFHIEPQTGLLNDPNGFSYFNGKFHLFYQAFPYGPVHGLKSWQHLTSEDLVHFKADQLKLLPDTVFENHGCYSGSALVLGDKLFLMYTGNYRDAAGKRVPYQLGAWLDKKDKLTKLDKPVIMADFNKVTEHFRDPNLVQFNQEIYALLGAQSPEKQGFIELYQAVNQDIQNWQSIGRLNFSGAKLGYMVECPNLVFIDAKPLLIFCPQGLEKRELDYKNIYPNTYVIGEKFYPETAQITGDSVLDNLDEGFDCYATQAFNAPDGRAFAISWLGLPDTNYPTDSFSYQGALSLVKELTIKNGKLYQYPVKALEQLRTKQQVLKTTQFASNNSYELEINDLSELTELILFSGRLSIKFSQHKVSVQRDQETRECTVRAEKINIFVDQSIFEIFINQGEKVFSGRIFPNQNDNEISMNSATKINYWELKYDR